MASPKLPLLLAAALLTPLAALPAQAQGTLRIGMTASDIPLTTGRTDNGGEGMRSMGYTVDDALWLMVTHDVNPRAMSPKVKGFVQAQNWFQDFSPISMAK
ncbi:hypothetical protein [Rhodoplanes roseus]|uniref:ABC transporter substrate-binding protein n=1 Tax=Rhodoplanes roseus TaxID=29409 RepID=A0A327L278_9BRAD|nr:hypothetical protein CH341_10885 [Rhodoplanes roseus]